MLISQVGVLIPTTGPEERSVRFWVRYRDSRSDLLPGPPLTEAIMFDTLAPRVGAVTFTQKEPVYVCTPGGPDVGGTNRSQLTFKLQVHMDEAGAGSPEFELVGATPPATGWRPPTTAVFQSSPQQSLGIRTRDALGNESGPTPVTTPAATLTTLVASQLPFAAALDCPHPTPARVEPHDTGNLGSVRPQGASKGARPGPGVAACVDLLQGRGIALNWVIAGTELKSLLAQKRLDDLPGGALGGAGALDDRPVRQRTHIPDQRELVHQPWRRSASSLA